MGSMDFPGREGRGFLLREKNAASLDDNRLFSTFVRLILSLFWGCKKGFFWRRTIDKETENRENELGFSDESRGTLQLEPEDLTSRIERFGIRLVERNLRRVL